MRYKVRLEKNEEGYTVWCRYLDVSLKEIPQTKPWKISQMRLIPT